MSSTKTAFIVGASRGLGLALAEEYLKRGWNVVATVRGGARTGLHALAERHAGRLEVEQCDINEPDQVAALHTRLKARKFDLLFVNAGVANNASETIATVSTEDFTRVMITNALSPMRFIEAFQDVVPATGTIGVMSSILGSVAENTYGLWEAYRGSKAALNTFMRSFSARHPDDPRALLLIAPGWVRTDMGGPEADLSIEESIPNVVDLITRLSGKPGVHYYNYDGRQIAW